MRRICWNRRTFFFRCPVQTADGSSRQGLRPIYVSHPRRSASSGSPGIPRQNRAHRPAKGGCRKLLPAQLFKPVLVGFSDMLDIPYEASEELIRRKTHGIVKKLLTLLCAFTIITLLYNTVTRKISMDDQSTLEKIHQAAFSEFLDKGFQGASLRQIVKNAGVTTGAFYGYFSSKEALFAALVEPHAAAVMGRFMQSQTQFAELPETEQPAHVGKESADCTMWMLDYIYQHYDAFKLLICCAQGTSYQQFIHNMVEIEVDATYQFIEVLRRQRHDIPEMDRALAHIIASGMFNGIFEIVVHDMPYEQAKRYVAQLQRFYLAGWHEMIGV